MYLAYYSMIKSFAVMMLPESTRTDLWSLMFWAAILGVRKELVMVCGMDT